MRDKGREVKRRGEEDMLVDDENMIGFDGNESVETV